VTNAEGFGLSDARIAFAIFFGTLIVYLSNATTLAQEPDNAAFIDSMGWVLYREGDLAPSAADIADRAGISARSLFRYFDEQQIEHPTPSRITDRGPQLVVDVVGQERRHCRSPSVATYGASRGR
jgi:AraC-like DNA-binding protein